MKYTDAYDEKGLFRKTGLNVKELAGMKAPSWLMMKMVMLSGRSWWQVMYAGGKELCEWETLQGKLLNPLGNPATSRWEEIEKRNLRAVRILCPNGQVGELRTEQDFALFQLKSGVISIGAGMAGQELPKEELHCHYHIIGAVLDSNGKCECRAWDYRNKTMIKFSDNVLHMAFNGIGPLSLEAVGIK